MTTSVFVGNVPYESTEDEIRELFAPHGAVRSVRIPTDRETGRARGIAFVEMEDAEEAACAIEAVNGAELDGRQLRVNVAEPRAPRWSR